MCFIIIFVFLCHYMKIVIIGAGNLATHLSLALQHSGHEVLQVYSRTETSAQLLASRLKCPYTTVLTDIVTNGDIYIFSVKDTVLASLAETVCPRIEGKVFLHTAGSMPMTLFSAVAQHYGVIYPMQTFSKNRDVDFSEIPCFLEASDEDTMQLVEQMTRTISRKIYHMDSETRRYLHLSAVWACNFTNHCYDIASELLNKHDIPFDVLLPLIDETARKVHELSPRQAQTGPAVRFDENVLNAQQQLMGDDEIRRELYRKLSESIHDKASTLNSRSSTLDSQPSTNNQ